MKQHHWYLIIGAVVGWVLANKLDAYPPFQQINTAVNGGADINTLGTLAP